MKQPERALWVVPTYSSSAGGAAGPDCSSPGTSVEAAQPVTSTRATSVAEIFVAIFMGLSWQGSCSGNDGPRCASRGAAEVAAGGACGGDGDGSGVLVDGEDVLGQGARLVGGGDHPGLER